jgi:hypothetical protein
MKSKNCASFVGMLLVAIVVVTNSGCGGGSVTTPLQTQPPPPQTFIITTTSLPTGTVNTPYSVTLQSSGATPPITWGLYEFSLPSGLSLSSGGTISGTPVTPGSSCLVFQGTDSSTPQKSAAQELCIAINSPDMSHNALLKGHYAFVTNGYSGVSKLYGGGLNQDVTAGSFEADGNGNIASGVSGPGDPLTGTYALGSDNRGTVSISDSTTGVVTTYAFSVGSMSASGVATKGHMIEFEAQAGPFVGEFELQDTTAFSNSAIHGSYAFVMSGWSRTEPFGADGVLAADGMGNFSGGTADQNLNGVVNANLPLTGTYTIDANSTDGRVTGTLTMGGTTFDFTFFVVSASKLLMIGFQTGSSGPAFIGQALKQSAGPFNNGSLNGSSIFSTMGMGKIQDVKAGLYNFDGGGTTTVLEEENNAGSVTLASTSTALYSVESDGRVSVATGGSTVSVLYLVSSNQGFILDTDTNAATGLFEPQAPGPFTSSSINGNSFFGDLPSSCCRSVSSGVATLEAGTISQTSDLDQPGTSGSGNTIVYGQSSSDTYTVLSNGRVTTGLGKQVIYIISPTKFLLIDVDPTNTTPGIRVAEQ